MTPSNRWGIVDQLDHQAFQRAPQTPTGQLCPVRLPERCRQPHVTATGNGGSWTSSVVGRRPSVRAPAVAGRCLEAHTFAAAASALPVRSRSGTPSPPVRIEPLAGNDEPESAGGGQTSAAEAAGGSVADVEIFQMDSVRTSSSGDLDADQHRRADQPRTLNAMSR